MKPHFLILIALLVIACQSAEKKEATTSEAQTILREVCITVDDLPVVSYSITDSSHLLEVTQKLIETYKTHKIPAIGYVNENKLYQADGTLDEQRKGLLELWLKNGYELGNHTFSHMSYHKATLAEYTADIEKGEQILKELTAQYKSPLKYFRHPYLHIGLAKTNHDSLKSYLAEKGYIEAPVTIDDEDYLFALAYHKAFVKKNEEDMKKIGQYYVQYMEAKLEFYEAKSIELFGRNIKHTLLIHANHLNADYLDQVAEVYSKRGYSFISQAEALSDSAYQTPITKYGNWGISWIDRWALSQGKKGGFFKEDPQTPEYIKNYQ